ncbi:mitochondrial distribution/morphology family 35/apoptosis [Gautieria morchelliformis]|nr:mitochondrial distribution/morphology family 35/apoptosis [Gautieria morchelliformis]
MASSLSPDCTPLKHEYDACFNAWFEGYLEPLASDMTTEQRQERSAQKAKEYQERCGKVWEGYRTCVQGAVKEKGLTELLSQARQEDPLVEPPPPHPSEHPDKSQ